jgi:hypothetical protein
MEYIAKVKIVEDEISSIGQRLNFVDSSKKEVFGDLSRKEMEYKEQIIRAERERAELRQVAEELKKRGQEMNRILGTRDNQMSKIDEKINELIKMRKEIAIGRENDLQNLLNF